MDSWSRPNKSQAVPPPFYITQGDSVRYCYTCGRIIGSRRTNSSKASSSEAKYCSDRCKRHKPSTAVDSVDVQIDRAIVALLQGQDQGDPAVYYANQHNLENLKFVSPRKAKKGDPRLIVSVSDIETAVFGVRQDPEKTYGRRKNRAKRGVPDAEKWTTVDMEDQSEANAPMADGDSNDDFSDGETSDGGGISLLSSRVRPPQSKSDVNGSIGGEKGWAERTEESPEMLQKRLEGQKRADEKESVKKAARRAVAFGLLVDAPTELSGKKSRRGPPDVEQPEKVRRKCEALMHGSVVEPSFAKGDWAIRWRED